MKQLLTIITIAVATVLNLNASRVDEAAARQVADQFFAAGKTRLAAHGGSATTRLAYTAKQERFYVFDRGSQGGFVVVAGDDRLPQVLGYGERGDFSVAQLPPAVKCWMDALDRQIEYLQSHGNAAPYRPAKQLTPVGPLMTTEWNQTEPYNNYCPTYTVDSATMRAVTGCVATATAQVMNYHQWPPVGRGSHSYHCDVDGKTPTDLSADFSQSVYQWDLMLDRYDANSSAESCDAVARLMSDVGISVDMSYGSSSGAQESAAMMSLRRYFGYSDRSYLLTRDFFSAEEWDRILVDELSAGRPIIYTGFDDDGGHAFVFDGFDADGYYHVNWGWGGRYDGYFLASVLNPGSNSFNFMQDCIFGVIPEHKGDEVPDFLTVRGQLFPSIKSVPLGSDVQIELEELVAQGNMLEADGYDIRYNGDTIFYAMFPISLGVWNMNGEELLHKQYDYRYELDARWYSSSDYNLRLPESLEDGEYRIKLQYSLDDGATFQPVQAFNGHESYIKMIVRDHVAYLWDCFLANSYSVDDIDVPSGIMVNQTFDVDVTMYYPTWWEGMQGPTGNVYLALLKDGTEQVAASELCEVELLGQTYNTYRMSLTAPAAWGRYELTLFDESGTRVMAQDPVSMDYKETSVPIFVLPVCESLVEDFESMEANTSTSAKNVQGNFTTWSFTKGGVRAPGEDRCNGTNSVMLKKGSTMFTSQPLYHNFILGQATIFNNSNATAKYTLEYSTDGGSTWVKANTVDGINAADVPASGATTALWLLNLSPDKPAQFRFAMVGGGSAATYVDDIVLYYSDTLGDVNGDGEVNIADINAIIDMVLSGKVFPVADVNEDSEVNIADVNSLIDVVLSH